MTGFIRRCNRTTRQHNCRTARGKALVIAVLALTVLLAVLTFFFGGMLDNVALVKNLPGLLKGRLPLIALELCVGFILISLLMAVKLKTPGDSPDKILKFNIKKMQGDFDKKLAKIEENYKEKILNISSLFNRLKNLSSTLDTDMIYSSAADILKQYAGVSTASIFLLNPHTEELIRAFSFGRDESEYPEEPLKAGSPSMPGWVANNETPLALSDMKDNPNYQGISTEKPFPCVLCIPLIALKKTLGVLNIEAFESQEITFPEDTKILLNTLVTTTACALANSRKYNETLIKLMELRKLDLEEKKKTESIDEELLEYITDEIVSFCQSQALLDPVNLIYPESLLSHFKAAGDTEQVIHYLLRITTINPAQTEAFDQLSALYLEAGNKEAALDAFERLCKLHPESLPYLEKAASISLSLNYPDKAVRYFSTILRLQPENETAKSRLKGVAHFYIRKENYDSADGILDTILSFDKDDTWALEKKVEIKEAAGETDSGLELRLARSYVKVNDPEKAVKILNKLALADDPLTEEALLELCSIYLADENTEMAKAKIKTLQSSKNMDILYQTGRLLEEYEQYRETMSFYLKVFANDPDYKDITERLAKLKELVKATSLMQISSIVESPQRQDDRYDIIEKLGEGGMGVVYKAKDRKLNVTVALKYLSRELIPNKEILRRFIAEAQTAANLKHPNIVGIYDYDVLEDKQLAFIAMEFIEGLSLRDCIVDGHQFTLLELVKYGKQICDTLDFTHEQNIVHRDIKPDNIMLDSFNNVKITDFGLAKVETASYKTQSGAVMGTFRYMPPEQKAGKPCDHRIDIYALGVTFFEMLIGKESMRLSEINIETVSEFLSEYLPEHPDIPPAIKDLIVNCLYDKPEDRYQRCGDISLAWEAL